MIVNFKESVIWSVMSSSPTQILFIGCQHMYYGLWRGAAVKVLYGLILPVDLSDIWTTACAAMSAL
jgi:hypothetical protein